MGPGLLYDGPHPVGLLGTDNLKKLLACWQTHTSLLVISMGFSGGKGVFFSDDKN